MKSLAFIHRNDTRFAVGDFYPVLSVFSYHELGNTLSPFPLLTTRPFRTRKNCTFYET